jgi:hypothetical protein
VTWLPVDLDEAAELLMHYFDDEADPDAMDAAHDVLVDLGRAGYRLCREAPVDRE